MLRFWYRVTGSWPPFPSSAMGAIRPSLPPMHDSRVVSREPTVPAVFPTANLGHGQRSRAGSTQPPAKAASCKYAPEFSPPDMANPCLDHAGLPNDPARSRTDRDRAQPKRAMYAHRDRGRPPSFISGNRNLFCTAPGRAMAGEASGAARRLAGSRRASRRTVATAAASQAPASQTVGPSQAAAHLPSSVSPSESQLRDIFDKLITDMLTMNFRDLG